MSQTQIVAFLRDRATTYLRAFPDNDPRITPCPHARCGALVPPYAIDKIIRSIADEIARAP